MTHSRTQDVPRRINDLEYRGFFSHEPNEIGFELAICDFRRAWKEMWKVLVQVSLQESNFVVSTPTCTLSILGQQNMKHGAFQHMQCNISIIVNSNLFTIDIVC